MGWRDRGVEIKTREQIDTMRRAGLVVGRTLERLRAAVRPGVTTGELDAIAEDAIRSAGATPSFLGYQGFPASICVSVNDEVVHGIPGPRVLREGDILSLDMGVKLGGFYGDCAVTLPVGRISADAERLLVVTQDALARGIADQPLGLGVDTGRGRARHHQRAQGLEHPRHQLVGGPHLFELRRRFADDHGLSLIHI